MPSRRTGLYLTVLAASLAGVPAAHGYEFAIDARTIGQGYQVRRVQPESGDVLLNRRRFTQTLRLEIWDLLVPRFDPAFPDKPRKAPFELSFTSSLRIDHDFGEFQRGDLTYDEQGVIEQAPAYTLVPEMGDDRLALDVLYAYFEARGVGGVLDLRLGRQLEIDTMDWFGYDGLGVTVHTPWHVLVGAHGGLLTRSSSMWATPAFEPDGTGSAGCHRVEPGATTWIDADDCAQRDALMPTYGLPLESERLPWGLWARLAWRRAQSPTSDAYPGAAPAWGVNEDKLSAEVSASFFGGGVQPRVAARQNFVLGVVDEARAGVRFAWADHAITPEAVYSFPSFDGDSIFNVFSSEPYTDYRLTYDVWPGRGRLRGYGRAFVRRFDRDDALGFAAGVRLRGGRGRVRLDLFHDSGYGGLRSGADTAARWLLRPNLELEGRLTVIQFEADLRPELYGTNLGAQAGVRWMLTDGVALHLLFEDNSNRINDNLLRVLAVLDLAFRPEL